MLLGKELPTCKQFFKKKKRIENKMFLSDSKECLYLAESCMSINIILKAIRKQKQKDIVTIWIPDYFCSQTLYSFKEEWVQIVYYPIGKNFLPQWNEIKNMLIDYECDSFIFVHYFGKYLDINRAREFCNLKKIILIEDCAHVMCRIEKYGQKGDFAIFSPHKTLPIPDGALLYINRNAGSNDISSIVQELLEMYSNLKQEGENNNWYIKKLVQKILTVHRKSSYYFGIHYGNSNIKYHVPKKMSQGSYNSLCRYDYEEIKKIAYIRRDNLQMMNYFITYECPKIISLMDEKVYAPYFAVYSLENVENKKETVEKLRDCGFLLLYWPDLSPDIKVITKSIIARELSEDIFVIPIHQDIRFKHLVKLYSHKLLPQSKNKMVLDETKENEIRWENVLSNTKRTNIPQDWEYGFVKKQVEKWGLKRFIIKNNENIDIGIVQLLEKKIFGIRIVVRVNRGPVFIVEYDTIENHIEVMKLIRKNIMRPIPIIYAPFIEFSASNMEYMIREGWTCFDRFGFPSSIVDLTLSKEELRKRLKPFWKKHLKQAEKQVVIKIDNYDVKQIIKLYASFLKMKNISGIPLSVIKELFDKYPYKLKVLYAYNLADQLIAYKVLYLHGNTGTSFIAWNTDEGREKNARTLLIFQSMIVLKEMGYLNFDLGGVDDINTEAVAHFKRGISGTDYRLLGEFIRF